MPLKRSDYKVFDITKARGKEVHFRFGNGRTSPPISVPDSAAKLAVFLKGELMWWCLDQEQVDRYITAHMFVVEFPKRRARETEKSPCPLPKKKAASKASAAK